ncbi:hypothetical protein M0657_006943 [Pyricularia oryzae]|uniref:Uncharacterized protein n=1 Tax=Pyricularia oryzae TaxID=318829 RepID=A0A4P7N226_PYROR|nr:hypothetical protein M9X92_008329 [Pyricularia oryzae]KAI7919707.1 hypothetical protein M0657_006943 [Pyricularia oryzae]QBZ56477.1 hypothetical protein PoMZ_01385 [Pyricularia oryzae]
MTREQIRSCPAQKVVHHRQAKCLTRQLMRQRQRPLTFYSYLLFVYGFADTLQKPNDKSPIPKQKQIKKPICSGSRSIASIQNK